MDIAAFSTNMAQLKIGQAVGIQVLKMAQDTAVQQSRDLIDHLQQNLQPHLGRNIDIKV